MDPWALLRRRTQIPAGRIYGFEFKFFAHCKTTGMSLPQIVRRLQEYSFSRHIVLKRRNLLREWYRLWLRDRAGHTT
jgi:hypothetical protein